MGMFDYIKLSPKIDLKLTKKQKAQLTKASGGRWSRKLQTKCFDNMLDHYYVDASGKLWSDGHLYYKPTKKRRQRITHTGVVEVHDYITNDNLNTDLSFSVELEFTRGVFKRAKNVVTEECDNSTRISNQKTFEENRKRWDALRTSTKYKIYKSVYKKPIYFIFNVIINTLTFTINRLKNIRDLILFW